MEIDPDGLTLGLGVDVVVEPLGPDWVSIRPALPEFRIIMELDRLPDLLDQTLNYWIAMNPGIRIRTTLGIDYEGTTVALHVRFDGP